MANISIESFKGLYTNTDQYSADGAIVAENVDIDLLNDIKKAMGYSLLSGVPASGITQCLGAIEFNGYIVAMLSNGTSGKLYRTLPSLMSWELIESTQTYSAVNRVQFVKYASSLSNKTYLIFVNGAQTTITSPSTTYGGVYYWDGASTGANVIQHFGKSNNPTGSVIEVHNDRLWVGDITYLENTAQANARHWIVVSKIAPESMDTSATINAMTVSPVAKGRTYVTTAAAHSFAVGDRVYCSSFNNTAGTSVLNGKYFNVTEVPDNTHLYIDADTNGFTASTSGTVTLRGNTWCPAVTDYDDALVGAGIFRCDNDASDYVMQLKSAFGALVIFKKRSIYFFIGTLESGNFTLARKMNLPYGAVSQSVCLTEGSLWFISQYGLSKIEGVTVKTVQTQLDNITAITYTEKIKPDFIAISNKANLVLSLRGVKLIMHNAQDRYDFVLDLTNGEFTKHINRLADAYVSVLEDNYAVWGGYVFLLESGYNIYDYQTTSTAPEVVFLNALQYNSELDVNRTDSYVDINPYTIQSRSVNARFYNYQTISGTNYNATSTLDTSPVSLAKNVFSFWSNNLKNGTNKIYIAPVGSDKGLFVVQSSSKILISVKSTNSVASQYNLPFTTLDVIHHYMIIYNNAAETITLYLDSVLQSTTSVVAATLASFVMNDTLIQGGSVSLASVIHDFSIFNYTTLSATYSDAQIAAYLYNNTFNAGRYKLVNELSYLLTLANTSKYKLPVMDFKEPSFLKQIKQLMMLIEGTATDVPCSLTVNLYYEGSAVAGKTISFDVKQADVKTWAEVTQNETLTWSVITSAETATWLSIIGGIISILTRRAFDLGYCKNIQIEFTHTNNDGGFKIAKMSLDVEPIPE